MEFKEIKKQIADYSVYLQSITGKDPFLDEKIKLCHDMLQAIIADPGKYDAGSTLNREWAGSDFFDTVQAKKSKPEDIEALLLFLSKIAREVTLRSHYMPQPHEDALLEYFTLGKTELTKKERENADFIWHSIPKYLLQELAQTVNEKNDQFEKKKTDWEKNLTSWNDKVTIHEENLKKYHEQYNFVGLSKAFQGMFTRKKVEKNTMLFFTIFFGLLLLLPVSCQLFLSSHFEFLNFLKGTTFNTIHFSALIPLIAIEIIILYFFRIVLQNYYSTKAQLLQLDHRQSLCAFIEGYSNFTKDRKPENSLSKFESLIFSGISPELAKIPSTFDGMEAVTKMFKEIKTI